MRPRGGSGESAIPALLSLMQIGLINWTGGYLTCECYGDDVSVLGSSLGKKQVWSEGTTSPDGWLWGQREGAELQAVGRQPPWHQCLLSAWQWPLLLPQPPEELKGGCLFLFIEFDYFELGVGRRQLLSIP